MNPKRTPWIAAAIAVILAEVYGLLVRVPLPFDYFAAVAAAGIAALLTMAIGMSMPARWIWTDAERLTHAFRRRHGLSDASAKVALDAITRAHGRAANLREAATSFADPLRGRAQEVADRLDGMAREVFYDPDTLSMHRKTLVRSELIEDATAAHARLRRRGESDANSAQMTESRAKVTAALDALEEAFDASETRLADQILAQVDVASATAEMLLAPRGARN